MSTAQGRRKGWCPGALRPMPAKDGLLVRLRVTAGRLSAGTLRAIAEAGRNCGNGLFDLSARGNLQMRGVREERLPQLHENLRSLGLLDVTAAGEAVRNVLVSPLSGLAGPDLGPVAAALERALVAEKSLHALPGKFGFLIDDGSAPGLGAIPADIRFVRTSPGLFATALGGSERDAVIGSCTAEEIVPTALRLARAFMTLSAAIGEKPRRMRDLLRVVAPEAIARAAGRPFAPQRPSSTEPDEPCPIGLVRLDTRAAAFGIGAAFGRLETSMLDKIASAAESFGSGEIRLTPWRVLLVTGVEAGHDAALTAFFSGHDGFITESRDPRLAVSACPGASGCDSATADTHEHALALAPFARRLAPKGVTLHVSGCAKGCARPRPTQAVLVAAKSRYDLVLDGTAGDIPLARKLDLAQASQMLEQIAAGRHVNS